LATKPGAVKTARQAEEDRRLAEEEDGGKELERREKALVEDVEKRRAL
jgi:hypothetical protein